jgi:glycosyltransferase involved in cell wall biosynthesis
LRIVHVPFTFAPDPVGGTEIYVEALAHELREHGTESLIVAPCGNGLPEIYEHRGLRVRRFRTATESDRMLEELYGEGDPNAAALFGQVLDEERPDAVHVHAFTRAVSVLLVRAAKQRGLAVLFTYHTPTVSCQRGTLMLRGKEPCDGVLSVRRCTNCTLQAQGLPAPVANLLSCAPSSFVRPLEKIGLSGGIYTALRMPELVRARHAAIHALLREVDGIVALKEWVRALLVHNGVAASKIVLSEHGLADNMHFDQPIIDLEERPLQVAFLGRADHIKGPDTVVKSLRSAFGLNVELHLYGVLQSTGDEKYWTKLVRLAGHDRRIKFFPTVPHDQVITLLRQYHLVVVPSRSLETGPLVVLEALAAGTPVVGSDLSGIADLVQHGVNGLLVEPNNIRAWANAFYRCAEDRSFLASLRCGVRKPRSMANVATEMAQLYSSFIDRVKGPKAEGPRKLL